MLSVLIVTYNWDAFLLVKELHLQLEKQQILFEIICIDDASNSDLNTNNYKINTLENCSFETLPKNIGRSAIRNLLAKKAQYKWLLFLDADVLPTSKNFISKYVCETENNFTPVFLGGIAYEEGNSNSLRWKLGKKAEEKKAEVRNKNPFNYFFTANFLIQKSVFNAVQFDENLTKYGYEDLLFAKELEHIKIKIKHLDNTVFHLGIDDNTRFINKTKLALENLSYLVGYNKVRTEDTKIYKAFFKLKKLGITNILVQYLSFFEKQTIKKSSLFYYHLFRLAYLEEVVKNPK